MSIQFILFGFVASTLPFQVILLKILFSLTCIVDVYAHDRDALKSHVTPWRH